MPFPSAFHFSSRARLLLACLAMAICSCALEVLKAIRWYWFEGIWPGLIPPLLAAAAIYFTAILLLSLFVNRMLRRGEITASVLSAMLLWAALVFLREEVNWAASALTLCTFPLAGILCAIVFARRGIALKVLSGLIILGIFLPPRIHLRDNAIIFIVADALRADYCSSFGGHVPTPNMDRLAARGLKFTNATAPAPWTLASMYSVATGGFFPLPQDRVPRGNIGPWLPGAREGLLALSGNWLLGGHEGLLGGLEDSGEVKVWYSLWPEPEGPMPLTPLLQSALINAGVLKMPHRPMDTSRALLRHFINRARHRGIQGACYLHFMDPHDPYAPPPPWAPRDSAIFSPAPAGDWSPKQLDENRRISLLPEEQELARTLYEAEIQYFDACLGRIIELIDKAGAWDKVTLVFTADHGEEFWDHGGYYHGHTLYQDQLHVPLIAAGRGVGRGVVADTMSTIQLMPALRALWEGHESPLLQQGHVDPAPVFAYGTVNIDWVQHEYAILADGWKLIQHREPNSAELYHLAQDPKETRDLAGSEPERVQALRALLDEWKSQTFPEVEEGAPTSINERLEALGYI